jgi:hypothetical protein
MVTKLQRQRQQVSRGRVIPQRHLQRYNRSRGLPQQQPALQFRSGGTNYVQKPSFTQQPQPLGVATSGPTGPTGPQQTVAQPRFDESLPEPTDYGQILSNLLPGYGGGGAGGGDMGYSRAAPDLERLLGRWTQGADSPTPTRPREGQYSVDRGRGQEWVPLPPGGFRAGPAEYQGGRRQAFTGTGADGTGWGPYRRDRQGNLYLPGKTGSAGVGAGPPRLPGGGWGEPGNTGQPLGDALGFDFEQGADGNWYAVPGTGRRGTSTIPVGPRPTAPQPPTPPGQVAVDNYPGGRSAWLNPGDQTAWEQQQYAAMQQQTQDLIDAQQAAMALEPTINQNPSAGGGFAGFGGVLGGLLGGGGGAAAGPASWQTGGMLPATAQNVASGQPSITENTVLPPHLLQAMMVAQLEQNSQEEAARNLAAQRGTGAAGFQGGSSTLGAQERMNAFLRSRQDATARREIPLAGAMQNAQQLLATQQAREGQYSSRQAEEIARRRIEAGLVNPLLSALTSLIS